MYRYSNANSGCGCARQTSCQTACPAPAANNCNPPTHNESISVPHHIYEVHRQPIVNKWLQHSVTYNTVPVSQETRLVEHPTKEYCTNPCPPNPCNNSSSYGGSYGSRY